MRQTSEPHLQLTDQAALDARVRQFFAISDSVSRIVWVFDYARDSVNELQHIRLRVEFKNGVTYDEESYQAPELGEEDTWAERVRQLSAQYSGALDELYALLCENLPLLAKIFPRCAYVRIASPPPGSRFKYVVKAADDTILTKIQECT